MLKFFLVSLSFVLKFNKKYFMLNSLGGHFFSFLLKVNTKCNFEGNETSDRDLNPALGSLVVFVFLFWSFSGKGRQARGERGGPDTRDG